MLCNSRYRDVMLVTYLDDFKLNCYCRRLTGENVGLKLGPNVGTSEGVSVGLNVGVRVDTLIKTGCIDE